MPGGFDDLEMQDPGEEYPEYNDMELTDLDNEYDDLNRERLNLLRNDDPNRLNDDPNRLNEVKRRLKYLENLQKAKNSETTFASDDRRTVTIKRKTQRLCSRGSVYHS